MSLEETSAGRKLTSSPTKLEWEHNKWQPALCYHVVLSDGLLSIDKMALSEFIDRYSRPKTGAASCWESRLMDLNWMRGQSFPLIVRAPPFPGGNLNQNLYQYDCRTDISFICCSCSMGKDSRLVGYDNDFWSAGASSLDIVHCFLLEPTDFDQPAG